MHAGNPHAGTSAGLQPGMAYHPQAGMNPALAQVHFFSLTLVRRSMIPVREDNTILDVFILCLDILAELLGP